MKLNYPIKYEHELGEGFGGTIYEHLDGCVRVEFDNDEDDEFCWTEDDVRSFIKDGTWIVTWSGSPIEASHDVPLSITLRVTNKKLDKLKEAVDKAVEAMKQLNVMLEELEE